ncbi:SPV139 putative EEV host range protein [Swinepox virus]|uniref:Complement control protein C3 n=1 Tax=Swinepox virus (strain Swine/Nebraska/17077-99/1999) TaxID=300880 RepID=Q8V3F7_SWPV1|nr:EEV Host range protein [Swinepox virus]AAL69878.1 SPV139 putative EEV host range protein [Swinepox virus]UED36615.1 EEV Host range protein [Swinepox virus]UED36764.1 EEV Host range protein [Swinepox virus]UUA44329.1 SPV139 [Swinepox virus]
MLLSLFILMYYMPNVIYCSCDIPPDIVNGEIYDKKEVYSKGDSISYICGENKIGIPYSLIGNDVITCNKDGKWYPDPPRCEMIICRFPALQNGYVNGIPSNKKFYYKQKVSFTCKDGFLLAGEPYSICNINSTWFPDIPICIKNDKSLSIIIYNKNDDDFKDLDNEDIVNANMRSINNTLEINITNNNISETTLLIILGSIGSIFIFGIILLIYSCSNSVNNKYSKLDTFIT